MKIKLSSSKCKSVIVVIFYLSISCQDSTPPEPCPDVDCNEQIEETYNVLNESQAEFELVLEVEFYLSFAFYGDCRKCEPKPTYFFWRCTIPPDTTVVCQFNIDGSLLRAFLAAGDQFWKPWGTIPSNDFTIKADSTVVSGI